MALQDYKYNEVRIRQGSEFQQIPNYVTAGEALDDGQFVAYQDGQYFKADQDIRATHFVQRAGVRRDTIDEITNLVGIVQAGEPVMAITGRGTATIPFASDAAAGAPLTVVDGYAVAHDPAYQDGYIIGYATEDVTIPEGDTIAWGEAFINLPALS